jgi:hypothetical protein
VIFVQPGFDESAARTAADKLGAEVLPLDPLAPDVLENLRTIGNSVAAALAQGN